eukprot:530113-Amphidinium_carterae.2
MTQDEAALILAPWQLCSICGVTLAGLCPTSMPGGHAIVTVVDAERLCLCRRGRCALRLLDGCHVGTLHAHFQLAAPGDEEKDQRHEECSNDDDHPWLVQHNSSRLKKSEDFKC